MPCHELLVHQHQEIKKRCRRLLAAYERAPLERNLDGVWGQLSALMSVLKVHLTVEERVLYPALLRHDDQAIMARARKEVKALDALAIELQRFSSIWTSVGAIRARPDQFEVELRNLCAHTATRIEIEDGTLIPLVKRLGL